MKIKNKVLLSITESDLINGHFYNDQITEIATNCFHDMKTLISVDCPNVIIIGYYCFRGNHSLTTLNLPLLTQCGNWCFYFNKSLTTLNLPLLNQCGNWCFYFNKSLTELNLPLLNQCDSYCFRDNSSLTTLELPLLTQCGGYCFNYNSSLTTLNIGDKKLNVENVDRDCFVIENVKIKDDITIYSGYNLIHFPLESNSKCFVAKKDKFTAHGKNIHKAVEDLLYKISVDKLKKEPVYPDTIVSTKHFKAITGACDLGMSNWKSQNSIIVDELKASELLILLEKTDAYGLDKFKQLYQSN